VKGDIAIVVVRKALFNKQNRNYNILIVVVLIELSNQKREALVNNLRTE